MTTAAIRWTFPLACALAATASAQVEQAKLTTVAVRDIKLQIPESWKPVTATSRFRVAQFEIPGAKADAESAELVVYYFGGPTGGIQANVERWIGQFYEKDRKVKLVSGKCRDGSYVLADISGTWKKPDGPPVAQKTIDKPGSRVIGVVLGIAIEGKTDYYFIKLSGPDGLVKSQAGALRAALGVDAKLERPHELKDAEN